MAAIDRLKKITFTLANTDPKNFTLPQGYGLNVKQVVWTFLNFSSWTPIGDVEVAFWLSQLLKKDVYPDDTDKSQFYQAGIAIANDGAINLSHVLKPQGAWTPPAAFIVEGNLIEAQMSDSGSGSSPAVRIEIYGLLVKKTLPDIIRISKELRTV